VFAFHHTSMNKKAKQKIKLEHGLRKAIEMDELELYYQPKINTQSQKIVGVEALIRWNEGGDHLIMPSEFITLAEELNLIQPINEIVLKKSCKDCKQLHHLGYSDISMAVNLSAKAFNENFLIKQVNDCLSASDLPPRSFEIELTENILMENTQKALRLLMQIKELGVSISVDDFGTGYSSLRYLTQFPLDKVKIDRSFVNQISTSETSTLITEAIITLAHKLNLTVVAEGVETPEQFEFLKSRHCDELQGFLFSKPLPLATLIHVLETNKGQFKQEAA